MAVPDTNTFTLQNVVDEVNPTGGDDLYHCYYSGAVAGYFDIRYSYYRLVLTSLYGFRNYNGNSILAFSSVEAGEGTLTVTVTHNFEPTYISKDNGATWQEASYNGTNASYTYTGITGGSYYIKAKDYKQEIAWGGNPFVVYDDWYLPSRDEMQAMYNNLYSYSVGNLQSLSYWTSSEWDSDYAWYFDMNSGGYYHDLYKSDYAIFRPVRHFTAASGAYSLRGTGPAGGYIYHMINAGGGNYVYYEAAPFDFSSSQVWSNVDYLEIGTTSTSIGTGNSNSVAITGQMGHTTSAAKDCRNLVGST